MGRQRHNLLLVSITLLFLFSSGCGLYLQQRQEQLVDTFYRNIHWNISQVMLESQRFLYDLRLYRAGQLEMATLSLNYDLLWNRLDIFLISSETADARERHGLGKALAELFEQIKLLEPQIQAGQLREGAELEQLQTQIAEQTRQIEQIGDQILSGQEREVSVNQIRSSLFWLQIWQLILLVTGGGLVFALIRANLQNRRLSLLDPLTRLGNRRALQEQLARSLQTSHALALVVLDLKRFKQVNDLLGYQVGDRLLQTVADKLQQAHGGHAYRLGGDEFAVILTAGRQSMAAQIQALMSLLHFEFVTRESSFELACRLGVAQVQEEPDPKRLLDQAILALNQAKLDADGDLAWFEPGMQLQLQLTQRQLHQLRDWLANLAPSPLVVDTQRFGSESGAAATGLSLRWQETLAPCEMGWLQEGGILGPVIARLLQEHDQPAGGDPLLIALTHQAQLAHVLAYLPALAHVEPILLLPSLQHDAALLAKLNQCACTLALCDIGSSTPGLLAAGWPLRYWLPVASAHAGLLEPLAQRLGLIRLAPVVQVERQQS